MADRLRTSITPDKILQHLDREEHSDSVIEFIQESSHIELLINRKDGFWEFQFFQSDERVLPENLNSVLYDVFSPQVEQLKEVQVLHQVEGESSPEPWLRRNFEALRRSLRRKSSANTTILKYASVESEDETLVIELADQEWVQLGYDRGIHQEIAQWIDDRLGVRPTVQFEDGNFEDNIQEDAERFEAEQEEELEKKRRRRKIRAEKQDLTVLYGGEIKTDAQEIKDLPNEESRSITIQGEVISAEFNQTSSGKQNIVQGVITDRTDSVEFKLFTEDQEDDAVSLSSEWVKMRGSLKRDNYGNGDRVIFPSDINRIPPIVREDESGQKRVELHCHSSMSAMDALCDVGDLVERAAYWDHPAIAITDHGVAHSFPEAAEAGKENGVKIIYGVEGYLVQDERPLVLNVHQTDPSYRLNQEYCVLDLFTTGMNPHHDRVLQVSAIRVRDGKVKDRFTENIDVDLSDEEKQNIDYDPESFADADPSSEVFDRLQDFVGEDVLVTYEGDATRHFLEEEGLSIDQPILHLRRLVEEQWEPSDADLETVIDDHWNETFESHLDAESGAEHILKIYRKLQEEFSDLITVEDMQCLQEDYDKHGPTNHIILLAINQDGLKNLYRLVSRSHTRNFHQNPRVFRSEIDEHRVGLLVGSACEAGEIFQSVLHGESDEAVKRKMQFYDFIEVQPVENNRFMLKEGGPFRDITSEEDIEELTRRIHDLGRELGKPVVGTGDVHFMDPEDEVYRRILQAGQEFDDADNQPPLYYRTTDEMIDRFRFLGEEEAIEVAVENPRKIADLCEHVEPIPDGFHPPHVEDAEDRFRDRIQHRVEELYGEDPPDIVRSRLRNEADSIIDHDFANLYVTAAELVDKSHEDGYLVGSRGSVGSSFTAYLMDITEVNPLRPHYRCPQCCHTEFPDQSTAESGVDLDPMDCPECGTELDRDGFNIPFEVFCGFEGEKIPDIDLNFSGKYQQEMFNYVEKLFGETNVFRAGTIDTVADKTAGGFVNGYLSERSLTKRKAEKVRLIKGLTGVKQNTSQHPGGMIIVPEDKSVYDFTPINYPANDPDARFQTTHFDYHAMEDQLVKLDVLGHDDPTQLRHLQELTGVDPVEIPLDDEKTMQLFSDISVLGIDSEEIGLETGVLGVPEFNTSFVRGMVEETRPDTFADLVRISGLSHGEQVWLGNAQDLIRNGTATLEEVISCRDDIMNRLIEHGMPAHMAFKIMEDVRKGRGLSEDQKRKMRAQGVPDWYVDSCTKISYLFPKAHAVAYVIMAFRIAYFKVHHPTEFYASYFSLKTHLINAKYVTSLEQVETRMKELERKRERRENTARDNQEFSVLEVIKEAYLRGISIDPPKLTESNPRRFTVHSDALRAPYVTVDGLGGKVAETLSEALDEREFSSIEDAKNRTGLNKGIVENAREYGFFEGLPDEEHYDLFGDGGQETSMDRTTGLK